MLIIQAQHEKALVRVEWHPRRLYLQNTPRSLLLIQALQLSPRSHVYIPIDPSASSRSTCNQKMNNTSGKRSDLYFTWRKISWYLPFVGKLKLQIDCTVTGGAYVA